MTAPIATVTAVPSSAASQPIVPPPNLWPPQQPPPRPQPQAQQQQQSQNQSTTSTTPTRAAQQAPQQTVTASPPRYNVEVSVSVYFRPTKLRRRCCNTIRYTKYLGTCMQTLNIQFIRIVLSRYVTCPIVHGSSTAHYSSCVTKQLGNIAKWWRHSRATGQRPRRSTAMSLNIIIGPFQQSAYLHFVI